MISIPSFSADQVPVHLKNLYNLRNLRILCNLRNLRIHNRVESLGIILDGRWPVSYFS